MTRAAFPLPSTDRTRQLPKGRGRARIIRTLYSAHCCPAEIAAFLRVDVQEVRRTVLRPAWGQRG